MLIINLKRKKKSPYRSRQFPNTGAGRQRKSPHHGLPLAPLGADITDSQKDLSYGVVCHKAEMPSVHCQQHSMALKLPQEEVIGLGKNSVSRLGEPFFFLCPAVWMYAIWCLR